MTFIEATEFSKIMSIIDAGSVIAVPTDTIYGLVCKYHVEPAIAHIYEIKNRPLTKPLQILVASWEQATEIGIFDEHLIRYLEDKFPRGRVTVIVKKQAILDKVNYWKQWDTVAIRVSHDPLLQNIINTIGPLAATSCNLSGSKAINDTNKINLPGLKYVVRGKILKPQESTIYDSVNKKIVRS